MRNRFQATSNIFYHLGSLLLILSGMLIIPIFIGFIYRDNDSVYLSFVIPAIIALFLGIIFRTAFHKNRVSTAQATLICSISWLSFSAIGAIPFVLGIESSYLDAYFETMSGFTTTGITMYSGLDNMPKSILFWRSLTEWIGGLGILTFFLALISQSGGGHNLFGAESHKIDSQRPVPGMRNTIKILWIIYAFFTSLIAVLLFFSGLDIFDSVTHSMTALSTGGFSGYDASIAHFQNIGHPHYRLIEYIIILGMLLGGTSFLVHYRVLFLKRLNSLWDNIESKYWIGFLVGFTFLIFIEVIMMHSLPQFSFLNTNFWVKIETHFRNTLFQVVSIITTTGFGTIDINGAYFGEVAKQLFLVMMLIGGSVGSTSGGFKVLRIAVLVKLIKREIFKIYAPKKAITYVTVNKKMLERDEIFRIGGLFFSWIALLLFGGLVTAYLSNHSAISSISGMFSALGNIGPCYLSVQEISLLHPFTKIVYIFGMLAGRLEIIPVLLLFSPKAWR